MVENGVGFPKASLDERIVSTFVFPLQNLQLSLEQIRAGAEFHGEKLDHLRTSNRFCRSLNVSVATVETAVGSSLIFRTRSNGAKSRLSAAVGLAFLGHAAMQAKGAIEKHRRQVLLDSKNRISKQDFLPLRK